MSPMLVSASSLFSFLITVNLTLKLSPLTVPTGLQHLEGEVKVVVVWKTGPDVEQEFS